MLLDLYLNALHQLRQNCAFFLLSLNPLFLQDTETDLMKQRDNGVSCCLEQFPKNTISGQELHVYLV